MPLALLGFDCHVAVRLRASWHDFGRPRCLALRLLLGELGGDGANEKGALAARGDAGK